jgi:hypothetical protein
VAPSSILKGPKSITPCPPTTNNFCYVLQAGKTVPTTVQLDVSQMGWAREDGRCGAGTCTATSQCIWPVRLFCGSALRWWVGTVFLHSGRSVSPSLLRVSFGRLAVRRLRPINRKRIRHSAAEFVLPRGYCSSLLHFE